MIRNNRTKRRKINQELYNIQTTYSTSNTNIESYTTHLENEVITNVLPLP